MPINEKVNEIKSVLETFYRELDHDALYRGDWRAFTDSFVKTAEKYLNVLYKLKYGTPQFYMVPFWGELKLSRRFAKELVNNPELKRVVDDFERFVGKVATVAEILKDKPLFAFVRALGAYRILTSIVRPERYHEVVELFDKKYGRYVDIADRYFRNVGDSRLTDKHHEEALRELHEEEKRLEEVRPRAPTRIHVEEENWMQILRPVKGSRRKVKA